MKHLKPLPVAAALIALPTLGLAQEAEAAPGFDEIGPYIMTTLLFLMAGFLVFFMAAGFAMLEGGLVRSKNVAMQMTKNIALFSVAAVMYWLIGFNLMYPGDGWIMAGWIGPFFSQTVLDPVGVAPAMLRLTMLRSVPTSSSSWSLWPLPPRSCPAPWPNGSSCGPSCCSS